MRKLLHKTKCKENKILSKVYEISGIKKLFIMDFYWTVNVSIVYFWARGGCLPFHTWSPSLSGWFIRKGRRQKAEAIKLESSGSCRSGRYKTRAFRLCCGLVLFGSWRSQYHTRISLHCPSRTHTFLLCQKNNLLLSLQTLIPPHLTKNSRTAVL